MKSLLLIGVVFLGMHSAYASTTEFEVNVRLPNGSYQRMIVKADTPANAKTMTESQYCAEKKNCVVSGPHLAH
jgi:hypothetical protein